MISTEINKRWFEYFNELYKDEAQIELYEKIYTQLLSKNVKQEIQIEEIKKALWKIKTANRKKIINALTPQIIKYISYFKLGLENETNPKRTEH